MSDYPHTRALLTRLCGLDETEAQLPVAVLTNLHRTQLREPLVNLSQIGESDSRKSNISRWDAAGKIERRLGQGYPALRNGEAFREHSPLYVQLAGQPLSVRGAQLRSFGWKLPVSSPMLSALATKAGGAMVMGQWSILDPLLMLYALTWPGFDQEATATWLELELAMDPVVAQMITDLTHAGAVVKSV